MASETPLKGILKNAVHGKESKPRPDPREVAIHHARILQQRKDLELEILDSVEALSWLPLERGAQYCASNPAPSDIFEFKKRVRHFQPSDYDDLIEERSANALCGYTLCPNPKPQPTRGGQWKLANVGTSDFAIVDRKESERWCSDLCKRRALYVKVQLSETAAWERIDLRDLQIELYGESHFKHQDPPAKSQQEPSVEQKAAADSAALALERGDVGSMATVPKVELTIREKDVQPPMDDEDDEGKAESDRPDHLAIEGYTPGSSKAVGSPDIKHELPQA